MKKAQKYFNTLEEAERELEKSIRKADTQNERVLRIIAGLNWSLTPFEVQAYYEKIYGAVPVTSIRRALNTLTREERLIKTQIKSLGKYGKKNYTWKINEVQKR